MINVKITIPHYSETDISIFNFTNETENTFNNKWRIYESVELKLI